MAKRKKQINIPYTPQRRMQTDESRLRFAIEFAQTDPKTMRPGDKLNLRDDLFLFAYEDREEKSKDVSLGNKLAVREMPDDQLEGVSREFRGVLAGLSMPWFSGARLGPVGELPTLQFYVGEGEGAHNVILALSKNPRDILLYRLMRLLESSTITRRLQLCPDCRRIFLKTRRQKYCSQRCANRSYMREYRAIGGVKDANHKQYERRMGTKPNRRPRRS